MDRIRGKTVIVTGASRGIGEAAARHMARLGAKVVLAARGVDAIGRIARQIADDGGTAIAAACDVVKFADLAALVDRTAGEFGRLDILVNNAGTIEPIAHMLDSDPEQWAEAADINYKGVYHGLRAAIPEMLKTGGGTVVNIGSGAASGALEGWSHYCSSKAAALMLTRCAHAELADRGIRVAGLSPGTVATEMQVAIKASGINPVSQLDPSIHIPTEWVAKAIVYLCGPDGAAFAGKDFSLRTPDARARVGLPPP